METEPVTKKQVAVLGRMLGFGAILVDLGNVDYTRGRGILEGHDRCLWTKDGKRITIGIITGGGLIASQAKGPDPELPPAIYQETD